MMTDLNVKGKTIKFLKDNTGEWYDNNCLDTTPKAWPMKETMYKLDFIKTGIFFTKDNARKNEKNICKGQFL